MKTEIYVLQYWMRDNEWGDSDARGNLDDLTIEAVRRCKVGKCKFPYRIIMRTDNVIVNEKIIARAAK